MALLKKTVSASYAIAPDYSSKLARLFLAGDDNATSSFLPVHHNDESLAWRMALIENAETSIDAQYYSWQLDHSGYLLLDKIIEAADRGVRVRLLLDDIDTFGADRHIATLNSHHNIEVRIFNPFKFRISIRFIRILELLWNLNRLTHRMHNKLIIVDNIVSIIGGRNIGDQYFGLSTRLVFRDLDLLASGLIVSELSSCFDLFWNHQISKRARRLIAFRPRKNDFIRMKKKLRDNLLSAISINNRLDELKNSLLSNDNFGSLFTRSSASVFYDPPNDSSLSISPSALSLYECGNITKTNLTIISAYFVPTDELVDSLQLLVDRGVSITVFTNSLESTDVTATFSGYQEQRLRLLRMGVKIYEFCASPTYRSIYTTPYVNVKRYSLHAKSIIYDSESVYVGTLNLDPRSVTLNTEIGLLINNGALAESIQRAFYEDLNDGQFWRLDLDENSKIVWVKDNKKTHIQPARGVLQRILNYIYSWLPIRQHL